MVTLERVAGGVALRHAPGHRPRARVLLLHGLGENRVGQNYLHAELAAHLCARGHEVWRLDLAGCGESTLPLSIGTWRKQVAAVASALPERLHLVARGAGAAALPAVHDRGKLVAVRPPRPEPVRAYLERVRRPVHRPTPLRMDEDERALWASLSVEVANSGGLEVPDGVLRELAALRPAPAWRVLDPRPDPAGRRAGAVAVDARDPLFAYASDRAALVDALTGVLEAA